ncbi:MAG: RnfABCDGE type electron transport complex subunit G [Bacteroidetes bacterium]|nr:RnfABCDGE type electron transport complex subunit G [Bacteroidota bacterium]
MAKMESTLKNMVLSLTLISMAMVAGLGFVYELTKDTIAKAEKQKEVSAVKDVLPSFDNNPIAEMKEIDGLTFYPAKKNGQSVGCAVKTFTNKAFSGRFDLMVGFLADGTIKTIVVLEQKETPGLGAKMTEPKFKDQFNGKNPALFPLMVKKDGGKVDAISAATISSRAFCDGVQKAYNLYMKNFVHSTSGEANKSDSSAVKGGLHE